MYPSSPLSLYFASSEPVVFPLPFVDTTLRFSRSSAFGLAVMGAVRALNTMHMVMLSFLWVLC